MVMAHVLDVYDAPFEWGVSDCCTSACDVFARLHGIDPMAPLRGRYASQAQAHDLIRARGGWRRMFTRLTGAAGLVAGRGDAGELGLIRSAEGFTLGIGTGGGLWAVKMDGGFQTVPGAILCRKP
jgi:hypothetical protein